jgi:hypothetical protein
VPRCCSAVSCRCVLRQCRAAVSGHSVVLGRSVAVVLLNAVPMCYLVMCTTAASCRCVLLQCRAALSCHSNVWTLSCGGIPQYRYQRVTVVLCSVLLCHLGLPPFSYMFHCRHTLIDVLLLCCAVVLYYRVLPPRIIALCRFTASLRRSTAGLCCRVLISSQAPRLAVVLRRALPPYNSIALLHRVLLPCSSVRLLR